MYDCVTIISLRKRARKPPDSGFQSTAGAGMANAAQCSGGKTCGLFGRRRSYLLERELAQLNRIADAGLRDLEDGLGDDFGEGIGSVRQLENAQAILVSRADRDDVFGGECRMLQQAVNRHGGTLQAPK